MGNTTRKCSNTFILTNFELASASLFIIPSRLSNSHIIRDTTKALNHGSLAAFTMICKKESDYRILLVAGA